MKYLGITPVTEFDGKFVKREDLACWQSLEYPSGSKVRQYMNMAWKNREYHNNDMAIEIFPPCLVGCSANSAMQIYVAATAKQLDTKGIIYVPKRKVRSDATNYAIKLGSEVNEIKPGYLSVIRKAARQKAIDLKQYVEWDRKAAIKDTMEQCINIPIGIKRIIVPTGSGLTAAGIIAAFALRPDQHNWPEIVIVATSPMANERQIRALAFKLSNTMFMPPIEFIGPTTPYDTPIIESLPDGTPLDPYYAAKAWKYVERNDILWPPGLRPVISMPEVCQDRFKDWKGPL